MNEWMNSLYGDQRHPFEYFIVHGWINEALGSSLKTGKWSFILLFCFTQSEKTFAF